MAIWLASLPVVYDSIESPADRLCADEADRFNFVVRAATDAAATFPPCTQDTILGDEREATPPPGTKIRIYIGPDGDPKIGTD